MTTRTAAALRTAADGLDAVKAALHALADDVDAQPVEYMTARQVADHLHVTTQTVYDWANEGRLPSKRMGRRRLFPSAAVRELAE